MNISIFEVIGPVMIGPSSSHTAGAARLARIAKIIADKPFDKVTFGLHGSFAKTYKGHGTDCALLAGAQGLYEDDENLACAFELANKNNIKYDFYEIDLDGMHENSVLITFYNNEEVICEVLGSSIGGGQILIHSIDGFKAEFSAQTSTLVIRQNDVPGVVSEVSSILAKNSINIGVMKVNRDSKGGMACCIIETDSPLKDSLTAQLENVPNVLKVQAVNLVR